MRVSSGTAVNFNNYGTADLAPIGIERWGQRAGRLASLLNKHTVAVNRWVAEAARQRQRDAKYGDEMKHLDERLSIWARYARARGSPKSQNLSE